MDGAANWVDSDSDSYEKKLTKEGHLRGDIEVDDHHSSHSQNSENLPQPAHIEHGSEDKEPADVEMRRSDSDEALDTPMQDDSGCVKPQHIGGKNNLRHEQDPHNPNVPRLRQEITLGEWIERSKAARTLKYPSYRSHYNRPDNRRYVMSRREYAGNWDDARDRGGGLRTLNRGYNRRGGRSGSSEHGSY